jgi:hypothetical protein
VDVPEGTEVFARGEDDTAVIYSTKRKISVTGASLTDIYYADAANGRIERLPEDGERIFFASAGGENLLKRRFELSQNDVLAVSGACEFEVELRQSIRFYDESAARMLADARCARWSYPARGEWLPFDAVTAEGNVITLTKNGADRLDADENGRLRLRCDIIGRVGMELTLSAALIGSRMKKRAPADSASNSTAPVDLERGGYCFGRRPGEYDMLYIRSDDVFRKRGALADVRLDISTIVEEDYEKAPLYEFNKRVISKTAEPSVQPDDVFVEEVVWEYYNDVGWAPLRVEGGEANPFSGRDNAARGLRFTVPKDISSAFVNSEEGYFIRARVTNVRNYLSAAPRRLLPFLKGADCAYQYVGRVPVDHILTESNNEIREIEDAAGYPELGIKIDDGLPSDAPTSMYLAFDAPPEAMPLALRFSLGGEAALGSKVVYETFSDGGFKPVRAEDGTQNLGRDGCVFLYIPGPVPQTRVFGQDAYWLRMSLTGSAVTPRWNAPRVLSLDINTVGAVQKQTAPEQFFSSSEFGETRAAQLAERPVLDCEVFVNENPQAGGLGAPDVSDEEPVWTPWRRTDEITFADGGERVYELDCDAGRIVFGNGAHGMAPPPGELNIRVRYSYGGGARGNIGAGGVSSLVGSIPRITGVGNVTPMGGGTDKMSAERVERFGGRRFKHRGVALGALDFEEMTLEKFPRILHARCFTNTDKHGRPSPGHVCLVLTGAGGMADSSARILCDEAYDYLITRCDANLAAGDKLHIVYSTEVTLSVDVSVTLENPDLAAVTQQSVAGSIARLIDKTWRARDIGEQADLNELYLSVRATPNVVSVGRLLPEGSYRSEGRLRLFSLDGDEAPPFMTVKNGLHTVKVG